jgi:hypothetical protein
VRVSSLLSAGLAALGLGLFLVKLNYLGEGYEGSWDVVVLAIAWLSILAALVVAVITTIGGDVRLKRRL